MGVHVGLLHRAGAADVGQAEVHARDQLADRLDHAAAWKVVDSVAIEDLGVHGGRRVDEGDSPVTVMVPTRRRQVDVHGRGELGGQRDALATDGLKARPR